MKTTPSVLALAFTLAAASFPWNSRATEPPPPETIQLRAVPAQSCLPRHGDSRQPQELVVKIDLAAMDAPPESPDARRRRRLPLNLAVVLDRSGSMSGVKIERTRQAATELVEQLADDDVFSLVVFDDRVDVLAPAAPVHGREDRERLRRLIAKARPGGSTALYAGVERGSAELERYFSEKKINRVLLLSDGLANVGPSKPNDLRDLGRRLSHKGLAVTTLGVGDDYDENLMSALAAASDANYYYVQDVEKLPDIFRKELGELLNATARDVRVEIELPEGVEPVDLIGREEKFQGRRAVVRFNQLAAGQSRSLFLRCRVAQGENADQPRDVATVNLAYRDELAGSAERNARQTVQVAFSPDEAAARASVNAEVATETSLQLNALAKDEAIRDADAGNLQAAGSKLSRQAADLEKNLPASAPAPMKAKVAQEAASLRTRAKDLENNRYDKAARKELQNESWQRKNAKDQP